MTRKTTAIIWTPDMIDTIRTERSAGSKWTWIAHKVGVLVSTLKVQRARWAAEGIAFPGTPPNRRVWDADAQERVAQWIRSGRSYDSLGAEFGADPDTIRRIANRLGVISKRARALQAGAAR